LLSKLFSSRLLFPDPIPSTRSAGCKDKKLF
jgi:hypothetical protein